MVSEAKAIRDTEWEAYVAQRDTEFDQAVEAEWRQTDEEWEAVVAQLKSKLQVERVQRAELTTEKLKSASLQAELAAAERTGNPA